MKPGKFYILLFFIPIILTGSGCTRTWSNIYQTDTDHRVTSSLADYLYPTGQIDQFARHSSAGNNVSQPRKQQPLKPTPDFWLAESRSNDPQPVQQLKPQPSNPRISTARAGIKVGLAFIPTNDELPGLSQAHKVSLLRQVQAQLMRYEFINHVDIIPQMHFREGRGFQHLEKIGDMFQLDAMALVSYDQVIHTDDNHLSLLYLTVIGAFIIPGSQFDSQTFVDTTLVDIKSKKFLLRASGIDSTKTATTLVGSTQEKRDSRYDSFENAFNDMLTILENNSKPETLNQLNSANKTNHADFF